MSKTQTIETLWQTNAGQGCGISSKLRHRDDGYFTLEVVGPGIRFEVSHSHHVIETLRTALAEAQALLAARTEASKEGP